MGKEEVEKQIACYTKQSTDGLQIENPGNGTSTLHVTKYDIELMYRDK